MDKVKLYISEKEDFSEDLLYADDTKLVSWFEESECEVETEGCELCLLEDLQNQKAIEELKRISNLFYGTQIQLYVENRIKELEKSNETHRNE